MPPLTTATTAPLIFEPEEGRAYVKARSTPNPDTGCWDWNLSIGSHGYGNAIAGPAVNGKPQVTVAHRVAYRAFVCDIPDKHQIDHRCLNRRCVNPDHLEAVTQQENLRRQWSVMKAEGGAFHRAA